MFLGIVITIVGFCAGVFGFKWLARRVLLRTLGDEIAGLMSREELLQTIVETERRVLPWYVPVLPGVAVSALVALLYVYCGL